jgi:hypothetical protein
MQVTLVQCSPRLTRKSSVFEWYERFKQGRGNMNDDRRSRPGSLNVLKSAESGAFI